MTLTANWQKWSWDDHSIDDSFNTKNSYNRKKIHRGCCW